MQIKEVWSSVPSLPEFIQVSNQGNARIYHDENHVQQLELKLYNGIVCFNAASRTIPVHRAVAEAFIINPKGFSSVKRKNNDVWDNRVENLYWGSNVTNLGDTRKLKCRIYCIERDILYGTLRSAANATGLQVDMIAKYAKEEKQVAGLTFKMIDSEDHSYDDYPISYLEFNDMCDVLELAHSVEEYTDMVKHLIEKPRKI